MALSCIGIKEKDITPGRGIISYVSKLPSLHVEYDVDKREYTFTGEASLIKDAIVCVASRRDIPYEKAIKIFGRTN
jgi:hypothetical protein